MSPTAFSAQLQTYCLHIAHNEQLDKWEDQPIIIERLCACVWLPCHETPPLDLTLKNDCRLRACLLFWPRAVLLSDCLPAHVLADYISNARCQAVHRNHWTILWSCTNSNTWRPTVLLELDLSPVVFI